MTIIKEERLSDAKIEVSNYILVEQKIQINQLNKYSCKAIIYNLGNQGTIQGLRTLPDNSIMVIVEFDDKTRIWISPGEIENILEEKSLISY
jgi:hypothetical protein